MELTPEQTDAILTWLTWGLVVFTAVWVISTVVGYFHRRTYNLTHADSGRSRPITPDFLDVDAAKRRAAIARGKTYDDALQAREVAGAADGSPAETASVFAKVGALAAALLTLLVTAFGTVTRVDAIEAGVQRMGSMDQFLELMSQHKVGATVALAVIGTQIVVFVKSSKKTLDAK